jgi:hypothetical protein
MNTYRVDKTDERRVPCGMNSIRYIGDSLKRARVAYNATQPGTDEWNQPKPHTFVILSKWNGTDYAIIETKELKQ